MRAVFYLGVFSLAVTGAAHANWQFTSWGQSLESLLAAEGHRFRRLSDEEARDHAIPALRGVPLLEGEYTTPDISTILRVFFAEDGLSGVHLELKSADDAIIALGRLKAQYGVPASEMERFRNGCQEMRYGWMDHLNGNSVSFSFSSCDTGFQNHLILYSPVLSAGQTGL